MRKFGYDEAARSGALFQGWTIDQLLDRLIDDAAEASCPAGCSFGCVHDAARALQGTKRIVEHPDDCRDCARIRAADEARAKEKR
jgi:hypothetical protein